MADQRIRNWAIFLRLLCESGEATRESGLYKRIIENFPIQFMQKLLITAADEALTQRIRDDAAAVMRELNDANILEKNYSKIENGYTLYSLRGNAIDMTFKSAVGSAVQVCGEQTALKLVRHALELEESWGVFLYFVEQCFTEISASTADYLDRILAIFRELPSHLRDKAVRAMKPRIERKRELFEDTIMQMLHQASDETPFLILPSIIRAFDQTISPKLTHWAITTPLFADNTSPHINVTLRIAEIYVYCIQHTSLPSPLPFSAADFRRMSRVIYGLAQLLEDAGNSVAAFRLVEAFVEKFRVYYPPRRN